MPTVIAVTCDRSEGAPAAGLSPEGRVRPLRAKVVLVEAIAQAIRAAGAEPLLLPPHDGDPSALIDWVVTHTDGVVLTGGAVDLHPSLYGEEVQGRLDRVDPGRAALELGLARACVAARRPVLAVCGGLQTLAVALGGTLVQDIGAQVPGALEHEQPTDPATGWHEVTLAPSLLRTAYGTPSIQVNSTHHQAIRDPGPLVVVGQAPDGVIEAVELPGHPFCVGVQWHPELLDPTPYAALVAAARG